MVRLMGDHPTTEVDLWPCPRCGGVDLQVRNLPDCQIEGPGTTVICKGCYLSYPMRWWNTRPGLWVRLFPKWFAVRHRVPR